MTTIYLVTEGDYSDYGIVCAFREKKDATQFVNDYNEGKYSQAGIEEWELYEGPVVMIEWHSLFVDLQERQPNRLTVPEKTWTQRVRYEVGKPFPRTKVEFVESYGKPWRMNVGGPDRDKVLKVARDRVAKIKAEEAGL